jgi:hypothetical protein
MSLADDMRDMMREVVLPCFVPELANFKRVRTTGTENHLGETVVDTTEELELYAIETTGLGKMDDLERTERTIGGQLQGEIVLMLLEDLLEEGDRVVRISNGEPWKVFAIDEPQLNGTIVVHNYRIRRQTD